MVQLNPQGKGELLLTDHTDVDVFKHALIEEGCLFFGVEARRTIPAMRCLDVDEDVAVVLAPFYHWLQLRLA